MMSMLSIGRDAGRREEGLSLPCPMENGVSHRTISTRTHRGRQTRRVRRAFPKERRCTSGALARSLCLHPQGPFFRREGKRVL